MTLAVWIAVALIGGIGALLRFHLDALVQVRAAGDLPIGTLVVNALGSLVLGLLSGAGVGGDALLLSGTALIGSFTTFSTWMLETERLGEDGDDHVAVLNIGLAVAVGLGAAGLGWTIGAAL